jgi:hypothetical protein
LYPNPASAGEHFFIQGSLEAATVTVYNPLGQMIPVHVNNQGNLIHVTPKTLVSQGVYIVTITSENQTKSVKWIVK